jgi:hypothetical protein
VFNPIANIIKIMNKEQKKYFEMKLTDFRTDMALIASKIASFAVFMHSQNEEALKEIPGLFKLHKPLLLNSFLILKIIAQHSQLLHPSYQISIL